jgi:hypothetical protein
MSVPDPPQSSSSIKQAVQQQPSTVMMMDDGERGEREEEDATLARHRDIVTEDLTRTTSVKKLTLFMSP